MDQANPARRRVFFEAHSGLPREGPGNRASTAQALALMGALPKAPLIVDIACGPGAQTLDLAALVPDARIVAIDGHPPFLDDLRRRAAAAGIAQRIDVHRCDMRALPVAPASADILWCEGAAYIIGVSEALQLWPPLLKPGGRIALTEAVWLTAEPPAVVRKQWDAYPAMTDVAGCRAIIARAGLKLLGDFLLPESAWWDDYYGPLEARVAALAQKYRGDDAAQAALAGISDEIEIYRRYSNCFGYQFFVMST